MPANVYLSDRRGTVVTKCQLTFALLPEKALWRLAFWQKCHLACAFLTQRAEWRLAFWQKCQLTCAFLTERELFVLLQKYMAEVMGVVA